MSKKVQLDNRPFKVKLAGYPTSRPKSPSKHWHNGKLLSSREFALLSAEEVHASNNVIKKAK